MGSSNLDYNTYIIKEFRERQIPYRNLFSKRAQTQDRLISPELKVGALRRVLVKYDI